VATFAGDDDGVSDLLRRVVLAISAFRSDQEVIALLRQVFSEGSSPFKGVLVVDSLSSGAIESEIKLHGWPVQFHNASYNLGAAGNHATRMKLAAKYDADWCFAVNADGEVRFDAIRQLVRTAIAHENVGAVYPTRFRPNRGQSWELARKTFLPMSPPVRTLRTMEMDEEVLWSSSNGALYNLAVARKGIFVWEDLWMGWEDLAYSWLLWKHGWNQIQCSQSVFTDPYEHRAVHLLGRRLFIHDKPPWISYYTVRNLALFVRRSGSGIRGWLVVLLRFWQEATLAVLFKKAKLSRIKLLSLGLIDGILGRTGMIISPITGKHAQKSEIRQVQLT